MQKFGLGGDKKVFSGYGFGNEKEMFQFGDFGKELRVDFSSLFDMEGEEKGIDWRLF